MGLLINNNVEETKILTAYGLTVYGKVNIYVWALEGNKEENALLTIRIADSEENTIFDMYMGNNPIHQRQIDDTMDNFLYWIATENPDKYTIEKQVYMSLCQSDCLFNHSITNKKLRAKREEEEKKRIAERKEKERATVDSITDYCNVNGLIPAFIYDNVYFIKALNEKAENMLKTADNKYLERLIQFIESYPNNEDAIIVASGTIEEILLDIS